ncbi:hypothetical protein [uncultured Veillonella sp.]|uniref:hypothetical protein n=1 Tax=uncultured Veillonella sp. TaxID=159268 RepID=UPI0026353F62|nr:hypothetical protein [uncultured Veillonella sp.]
MEKIKDFIGELLAYFIVVFILAWLIERITGWLFNWTPAENPILLGSIPAFFSIVGLYGMTDGAENEGYFKRISFSLLVTVIWGLMTYGDYSDIFVPPENPTTLDMIMMFLFPTTIDGTIFDGLNFVGSLIIFFINLIKIKK